MEADKSRYGLIGEKLGHSYSKIIHEMLGYGYDLWEIRPDELSGFIKKADFDGINVTIPYKRAVMEYLDEVSEEALRIGAVNTVYKKDGRLIGTNLWGDDSYYNLRSMNVFVSHLRAKLQRVGSVHIASERGVGYKLGNFS